MDKDKPLIPEELLDPDGQPARPGSSDGPSILGLPGLPAAILDLLIEYGPLAMLAIAVFSGFSAVSLFISLSSPEAAASNTLLPVSAFLSLAAAVVMALSYVWLTQKRRVGWNLAVVGLVVQILAQLLASGTSNILYSGVEVLVTAYVMLQIRDAFSK